jgi:hypothetical protein
MSHDEGSRDLIGQYLNQLRMGLRGVPGEAEAILAEAEDHLRETAAAGVSIGMTEREAQEAAISSFGPVGAVTHAHMVRLTRGAAALASAAMAAWKLASLLLLVAGIGAMAARVLSGTRVYPAVRGTSQITRHLAFNPVSGVWRETVKPVGSHGTHPAGFAIEWTRQPIVGWHTAVLLAVAGAVLLAGYGFTRRRRPHEPLARLFPAVAASVFGAIGLVLLVVTLRTRIGLGIGIYDPRPVTAGCLALALGYAVRLGQTRLRQR